MAQHVPEMDSYTGFEEARAQFARDGFLIARQFASKNSVHLLRSAALSQLDPILGPAEYEADVGYPGGPASRFASGGDTPRRLLHALSRNQAFFDWATAPEMRLQLQALLGAEPQVSQCHHNCIMTKYPGHSSRTGWHQDIRYWNFDRPELVSVWLALGDEVPENGALRLIPGSHKGQIDRGRLDASLFLRDDLKENEPLIDRAITVSLQAGDVLFFHCNTFHAAGRNDTTEPKLSAVFTYHAADNRPIPGTRSANYPSLALLSSDEKTGPQTGS